MGVTADLELRSALDVYSVGPPLDENVTRTLFFAELILTVAFLVELLLTMFVLGTRFWTSPNWKFNVLDMVVVEVSAFDVAMQSFTASFGRLLRLLKVFTTTLRTLHPLHNPIKLRTMMLANPGVPRFPLLGSPSPWNDDVPLSVRSFASRSQAPMKVNLTWSLLWYTSIPCP